MSVRRVAVLFAVLAATALAAVVSTAVPAAAGEGDARLEDVLPFDEADLVLAQGQSRHVDDPSGDTQGPDIVGVDFVRIRADRLEAMTDLVAALRTGGSVDTALYGGGVLAVTIEVAADAPASWGVLGATPGETAVPASGQQFAGVTDGARGDPAEAFSWNGQGFTMGDQSNGPKGVVAKRQGTRIVVLIPLSEIEGWTVQDIHAFVQTSFDNVRPGGRPLAIAVDGLPERQLTRAATTPPEDEPEAEPEDEATTDDATPAADDATPAADTSDDGGGGGTAAAVLVIVALAVAGGTVYVLLRRRRGTGQPA